MVRAPAAHDEVRLQAMEVPISVSITGARADELHAELRRAWAWCERSDNENPRRRLIANLGDAETADVSAPDVSGNDLSVVMERLTTAITLAAMEERAGQLLMLHASGLADPSSGRTIVMVGPSTAGKTTAALTLSPGRAYITDETVALDESGAIVPYPKPLSVRVGGTREQVMPGALGALLAPADCRVAQVLFLNRDENHDGDAVIHEVPKLEAMSTAASETSFLMRLGQPLHRLARLFEPVDNALRVAYRDAHQLDGLVSSLLGS